MKFLSQLLLTSTMFFGVAAAAFAGDTHTCIFEDDTVEAVYKFVFHLDRYEEGEKALVEIYEDDSIVSVHVARQVVDPDSSGDGWSMVLEAGENEFDLIFTADTLISSYLTVPDFSLEGDKTKLCDLK